jgi:dipeptidyl aminopeptidase/acylaminoacyl peptidase
MEIYQIENLSKLDFEGSKFSIKDTLYQSSENTFIPYLFNLEFQPNPNTPERKKTSGLINIPKDSGKYPLILMIRGYVDQKIYTTGVGTKRAGEYFASNGFITISPDFLGYGQSDEESKNIFESRFQTYTTVLYLLQSINSDLFNNAIYNKWDGKNIFIWGHSNGGHIALAVLEITQKYYPTSLWAPVSKPFPYSILYYTDESEDKGKLIRYELSKFENIYNVEKYSIYNFFDKINSPILLQQGTIDDAVPINWSDNLYKTLKNNSKDIKYLTYEGSDHNMNNSWDKAVKDDLSFYLSYLDKN